MQSKASQIITVVSLLSSHQLNSYLFFHNKYILIFLLTFDLALFFLLYLKDTHREKAPQIKLQRFLKVQIWTFEWFVHQINSLYEVRKVKQNFRKTKVVTGKTPLFLIDPFCTPHSICVNIGFRQSIFVR